jgi:glutamate dehydrogenase (NADP+)
MGQRPWRIPVDVAIPCTTQNVISVEEAQTLLENGVQAVFEGANIAGFVKVADAMLAYGAV